MALDFSFLANNLVDMPTIPMAQPLNMPAQNWQGKMMNFLSDPNFLQGMGRMGASLSQGDPFGVAADPSEMIRQIMNQKAGVPMLKEILGGSTPQLPDTPSADSMAPKLSPETSKLLSMGTPTPQNEVGPNSYTLKSTPDGDKVTFDIPSERSRNAYAGNVPAEAQPKQGGSDTSPFFKALFA